MEVDRLAVDLDEAVVFWDEDAVCEDFEFFVEKSEFLEFFEFVELLLFLKFFMSLLDDGVSEGVSSIFLVDLAKTAGSGEFGLSIADDLLFL